MFTVLKWLFTSITALGCTGGIIFSIYATVAARQILLPFNTVTFIVMALVLMLALGMIVLLADVMTDDYWKRVNRTDRG